MSPWSFSYLFCYHFPDQKREMSVEVVAPGCWDLCCVSAWSFLQTWPVQPLLVLILLLLSFFWHMDFVCCAVFNNHLFCFVLFYFMQKYFCMPLIVLYSARGQRSLAFLVRQRRLTLSFMPYCYVDMSIVASTCARAWALSSPDALFFTEMRQCTLGILELDFAATLIWFFFSFFIFFFLFFFCSLV